MPYDIAALPLATTLGIALISAEKDRVVGQLAVREEITTGGHILHGAPIWPSPTRWARSARC